MRKKKESFFWSLNQTQTVKSSRIRMIISLTYNTYSKTIPVSQYNLKYFELQLNVSKNKGKHCIYIKYILMCFGNSYNGNIFYYRDK